MLKINQKSVPIKKFPNGEIIVSLKSLIEDEKEIEIEWNTIQTEQNVSLHDEMMFIMLFVNTVQNSKLATEVKQNMTLAMNMLPYARQDRAMNFETPVSNKVMINLLNSLGFKKITVNDIHSDSSRVLFNDGLLEELEQKECFYETIKATSVFNAMKDRTEQFVFISPDAGAYKKIFDVSTHLGEQLNSPAYPIITAQKHRDLRTGQITETYIDLHKQFELLGLDESKPINVLVVDDICDGGRTFIELAKAMDKDLENSTVNWNVKKHLYVTHGLFSKGKEVLSDYHAVYAYSEKVS